jgi:hypothetical protein
MTTDYSLQYGLASSDFTFADYGKSATLESACKVNKAYPKKLYIKQLDSPIFCFALALCFAIVYAV